MRLTLTLLVSTALTAGLATAQGSDSCSSAQAISGLGQFPFSNVGATNDGSALVNCTQTINSDVWWQWTAPSTGTFLFQTCGGTTLDTVIAVYPTGSCPPNNDIACNDDACGLQSVASFSATSGSSYLLRLGSFSTTTQGSGNMELLQLPQGGSDLCANAQPISGTGLFPWNNTGANTDGNPLVNCTQAVNSDIWFAWTAPTTDQYLVRTCSQTSLDTVMAAYAGTTCPTGPDIACNDDSCGLQSSISFGTTAGSVYLIRLGSYSTTAQGYGFMEILVDPCNPSNDDNLEDNDDCSVATAATNGSYVGLWTSKSDHDWYGITVPDQATIQVDLLFSHANGDIDTVLYDACGGNSLVFSLSVDDDEQLVWTNTTGGPVDVRWDVYVYTGSSAACNVYDMIVQGGSGGIGTKYCTANSNSTGSPADLTASGSNSSSAGTLHLEAAPVPNQNGIMFHGLNQTQVAFGNGFLCASGGIVRGAVVLASGNLLAYTYNNSDTKHSVGNFVGATRNFQAWFRDPMGGGAAFNTSNAMAISILP